MLDSATIEPIERSKPPASMTNVSPIETTQRIAALVSSALMFPDVKKRSWVSVKTTKSATKQDEHREEALARRPPAQAAQWPGRTARGQRPSRSLTRRPPSRAGDRRLVGLVPVEGAAAIRPRYMTSDAVAEQLQLGRSPTS